MTSSKKPDTFTAAPGPRADRFRIGDRWQGSNGRLYVVVRGLGEGLVTLAPVGWGPQVHLAAISISGFQRVSWGGQP